MPSLHLNEAAVDEVRRVRPVDVRHIQLTSSPAGPMRGSRSAREDTDLPVVKRKTQGALTGSSTSVVSGVTSTSRQGIVGSHSANSFNAMSTQPCAAD